MSSSTSNGTRVQPRVGIVGAGFGGIGMGARLRQAGFTDFKIFERGEAIGGVWRANTYPGAACDVPSHAYSFSFAPGHQWTRRYAPRPDIIRYINDVADDFGLRPNIELGTEVTEARFEKDTGTWTLKTGDGTEHVFDVFVTACGQLTNPAYPRIEGMDDFGGHSFHSAEWDHEHDLSGERVAVIGSGASAIQFVPRIAEQVGKLDIYQRSAPWILPKMDRGYPAWERGIFKRLPARIAASRLGMFAFIEAMTYGFTGNPAILKPMTKAADSYRDKELADHPEIREQMTPDYTMGCKRVLFTSDWYETLKRPNVEIHTGEIERFTETGIVGPGGNERELDTVIYGTGFKAQDFVAPMEIYGREGKELNSEWDEDAEAYLGTTVAGYPNLFIMYGPNTNHGSGSVPYTLECQFNYVIDALRKLRSAGLRYVDLKPEVQERWREEIDARSKDTVWTTGGCENWYVNGEGRNTNNWPGPWREYRDRTASIDLGEYETVA